MEKIPSNLSKIYKKKCREKIVNILGWSQASYRREYAEFLAKQNEGLAQSEWKITCELFAPYAPEENPVEAIWFQLKSLLRRFYRFGKNFKIINLLFQLFAKYNLFNFPNLKRFDAFSQFI
jgi:transposase